MSIQLIVNHRGHFQTPKKRTDMVHLKRVCAPEMCVRTCTRVRAHTHTPSETSGHQLLSFFPLFFFPRIHVLYNPFTSILVASPLFQGHFVFLTQCPYSTLCA